ncbi:LOW QUALITY PROTEIN: E3 ubiquitin-protein ligase RNF25 [Rhineura floridana]|uniref:LOW QUALITY PROTEIN: E3 ubiquitin-protein ligase RNF25 n=1 Tax=Rhineura floridana TaxID=261503 RepID=UPI002AC8403C|nr:LOW QUALITY PROTEIN: E3 ubiquitin-protein ligase RNF25 [Rhineura floridana]
MAAAGGEEQQEPMVDWALLSEVEVLESIYLDELHVSKGNGRSVPWEIFITLHPATAEDQDSQYVCFTLMLSVPLQYPNEVPKIAIRNPRGLSDEQIQKISQTLQCITEARLGTAMLYELIEKGKEILTDNNIPHGQCVICLYGFQENEAFTKTPCYHYFHSRCLASYTEHMEEEIRAERKEMQPLTLLPKEEVEVQCPVCREPLVYDLATLQAAPPPQQPMEMYQPDTQTLQHREQLRLIYQRQQEKGGIIDPEAERNRYFISLQKPPDATEHEHVAISENVLGAEKELQPSADSEHTQENAKVVVPVRNEPEKPERPSVPFHLHSKRERTREEKPSLQGPGWQLQYKSLETPAETCCLLTLEGESRAFSRRPNWRKERGQRTCGRYNQDFPKSCGRDEVSSRMDKKELHSRGISPTKEGTHLREEKNVVRKWTPEQKSQAQDSKEVNLEVCHNELRGPAKRQDWCGMQDYRQWEKTKGRERGSYPKMPRGRGRSRLLKERTAGPRD